MTAIEEYVRNISANWPDGERGAVENHAALETCICAIRAYPHEAQFHVLKGCLIQLGPDDDRFTLEDAEAAFQKALEIDPQCEDACRELGHYYDAVAPDEQLCEKYFGLANQIAN